MSSRERGPVGTLPQLSPPETIHSDRQIKVLSWNIWHGQKFDQIVTHLKVSDPDIIGLQEVVENDSSDNTAAQIAQELGFHYVFYTAFENDRRAERFIQGNAVLSRFPIINSSSHLLSSLDVYRKNAETEPRIAVEALVATGVSDLRIFTTHLAYSPHLRQSAVRDLQAENLLQVIPSTSSVLMGDFNSSPQSALIRRIAATIPSTDPGSLEPTWTVYPFDHDGHTETGLRHRLDYIFASPDIQVLHASVEQASGSDHLPVSALIKL